MNTKQPAIYPTIDLAALISMADTAGQVVQQARKAMLAPTSRKAPPRLSSSQLAELCGIERSQVLYHSKRGELPPGEQPDTRREWSLADARIWAQHFRKDQLRAPSLAAAVTIAIANYKGGVSKTTTTAGLAMGLARRGHKVLAIDVDPQGSLSTLFGLLPDVDVDEEQTVMSVYTGEAVSIMPAIQGTYYDGVDIVAAAPVLFNAEFILPNRTSNDPDFAFWRVLDRALEDAREVYDIILIDTPPSLSYSTIASVIAADGVLMPCPPSALDFMSSVQFWQLLTNVCSTLFKARGESKTLSFIDVVLSRVDKADIVAGGVRNWMINAYGSKVLSVEIPKTSIAASASASFSALYDLTVIDSGVQAKTLKRAFDAFELLVDHVEKQIQGCWEAHAEQMRKIN